MMFLYRIMSMNMSLIAIRRHFHRGSSVARDVVKPGHASSDRCVCVCVGLKKKQTQQQQNKNKTTTKLT